MKRRFVVQVQLKLCPIPSHVFAVRLELRYDGDKCLSVARWNSSRIHGIATLKAAHQAEVLSEGCPIGSEQIEHPSGLIDSAQRRAGADGRWIVFVERQICGNEYRISAGSETYSRGRQTTLLVLQTLNRLGTATVADKLGGCSCLFSTPREYRRCNATPTHRSR